MDNISISQAVIKRLPRYYRYLGELADEGVQRISSRELSELMHVTASQIRQDLNHFGGFGQQGYGYNVRLLYDEISKILGIDKEHSLVIIGAGHLGKAIAGYTNFTRRGFVFKGAFDCDPTLYGTKIRDVEVRPIDEVEDFIKNNKIEIAVLTIPKDQAVPMAHKLCNCGIKAIWNFAHVDLEVPDYIVVPDRWTASSRTAISSSFVPGFKR